MGIASHPDSMLPSPAECLRSGDAARDAERDARGSAPAGATPALPPDTNRGVMAHGDNGNDIQVSLHWVTVTVHTNATVLVPSLLKTLYRMPCEAPWDEYFPPTGYGGRGFQSLCYGPWGLKLYHLPRLGNYCSLEIPGDFIEWVGQDALCDFMRWLKDGEHKWRVTRLDVAFDRACFKPRHCYEAWREGNVRCEAQRESYKWLESPEGDTFYIGARSSPRFVRIYDRRGPTRVELELKKPIADSVAQAMIALPFEEWLMVGLGHLRQFLDFVDAKSGKKLSLAPLLPWWEQFVCGAARAEEKYTRPEAARNLVMQYQEYLTRLIPTLCVYKQAFGVSLDYVCDCSEHRLKELHRRKIETLRQALADMPEV